MFCLESSLWRSLPPSEAARGWGFLHKFGPCRIYGGTFPRLNQTGEGFLLKFAPLSAQNRATFRGGPSDPNRWTCSTGWNLQLNCGFCSEVRNAVPLSAHKTERHLYLGQATPSFDVLLWLELQMPTGRGDLKNGSVSHAKHCGSNPFLLARLSWT